MRPTPTQIEAEADRLRAAAWHLHGADGLTPETQAWILEQRLSPGQVQTLHGYRDDLGALLAAAEWAVGLRAEVPSEAYAHDSDTRAHLARAIG